MPWTLEGVHNTNEAMIRRKGLCRDVTRSEKGTRGDKKGGKRP